MRSDQVTVRRLESPDVEAAGQVMRTAFGTYLGLPEPGSFGGDAELVRTRSQTRHPSAFVAEAQGRVVGSSFVTRWGEFGLFGPLTVDPSFWDAGVGGRMMGQVTEELDDWGAQLAGLLTFPNSPKHMGLYHRHGFFPRALTAPMERHVSNAESAPGTRRMSELSAGERAGQCLRGRVVRRASVVRHGNAKPLVQLPGALAIEWVQGDLYASTIAPTDAGGNPIGTGSVVRINLKD